MAIARKINFNLDKLKICYKQPDELFDFLSSHKNGDYVDYYGDFGLRIIDNGRKEGCDKPSTNVTANVLYADNGREATLGKFEFNNSPKYDGRCFFTFENSALYDFTGYAIPYEQKCNRISCLPYITDILGLTLNNITELEIAADTNINPIGKLRKYIKNCKNYDMIVNSKRIVDERQRINGYAEMYGRTRLHLDRMPTLYFHQAKSGSIKMRAYNKTKEIAEESGKEYIAEWNDYGNHPIYRIEVGMRNEDYRQWLSYIAPKKPEWGEMEASVGLLDDERYRCLLWDYCTHRLVYFKPKGKRDKTIDIVNILEGTES